MFRQRMVDQTKCGGILIPQRKDGYGRMSILRGNTMRRIGRVVLPSHWLWRVKEKIGLNDEYEEYHALTKLPLRLTNTSQWRTQSTGMEWIIRRIQVIGFIRSSPFFKHWRTEHQGYYHSFRLWYVWRHALHWRNGCIGKYSVFKTILIISSLVDLDFQKRLSNHHGIFWNH